jgi:biotin synthase
LPLSPGIAGLYNQAFGNGGVQGNFRKELSMIWNELAERTLQGQPISRAEALQVLAVPEEELMDMVAACYRVRRHYHGNRVKLNMLINAKSGLCAEDCGYCSQSIISETGVDR